MRATTRAELEAALDDLGAPYVVKADGLAAGKGVIVTDDRDAALAHADAFLPLGPVLVEEFLAGPEVSLFFLSDGDHVLPLSPAQDYKRLLDGDAGPNTGGMGAYSPLPWLSTQFGGEEEFVDLVTREVAEPVIRQLDAEGTPFIGLLYAGLILTESGVKVIEFNARFGDPETQVVLPRLVDPLSELLLAAASGHLEDLPATRVRRGGRRDRRARERGLPAGAGHRPTADGAGCRSRRRRRAPGARGHGRGAGGLVATGGRVLNVVGLGTTFAEARDRTYRALAEITLEGGQHRTDIAARVVEHDGNRRGQDAPMTTTTGIVGGGIVGIALAQGTRGARRRGHGAREGDAPRPAPDRPQLRRRARRAVLQAGLAQGDALRGRAGVDPGVLRGEGAAIPRGRQARRRRRRVRARALAEIERRSIENGVPDLARIDDVARLREIEPHVAGVAAVHSPHTAVVDYATITEAMAQDVRARAGHPPRPRGDRHPARGRPGAGHDARLGATSSTGSSCARGCSRTWSRRFVGADPSPEDPAVPRRVLGARARAHRPGQRA